ncbi:MAG: hypothetical protein LBU32_28150 [Clostridiales bacterium]|jgi:hypothetical protein|nr:hypothetical protein [Clostridiales bacterium]
MYFLDIGLFIGYSFGTPEQLKNGAMWQHVFKSLLFAEILEGYYSDDIIKPALYCLQQQKQERERADKIVGRYTYIGFKRPLAPLFFAHTFSPYFAVLVIPTFYIYTYNDIDACKRR